MMKPQTQWVARTMPAGMSSDLRLSDLPLADLHIGTPGFQMHALLEWRNAHSSDTLYLLGDTVRDEGLNAMQNTAWHGGSAVTVLSPRP